MNTEKVAIMPRQPKDDQPGVVPVKMSRELHRKAKMVALSKDMELYEYLDSLLRPTIEREHKQLFRGKAEG